MPELPEVETITRQLNRLITGKSISAIHINKSKSFIGNSHLLINQIITNVSRRQKMGIINFKDLTTSLLFHLKMTGQLIYVPADQKEPLSNKHTRVIIIFTDQSKLFFNDQRIFGWLKIINHRKLKVLLGNLPPDVIDSSFTLKYFSQQITASKRAIKLLILDQAQMGGLGNIYANDALWLAKINPVKPGRLLTKLQIKSLYLAIIQVINTGINSGGATFSNYLKADGQSGNYQKHSFVYQKQGYPCPHCYTTLKKIKIGGRGTVWCPLCQS